MSIDATVALGGAALRHLLILGDSITYGYGNTAPKQNSSWPGVLRSALNGAYGNPGTGIVLCNNDLPPSNMAWDGRMAVTGTMTEQTAGWYRAADWRFAAGSGNYLELAASGTEAIVTLLAQSSGIGQLSVDGGATQSFRVMASGGATPDIDKQPGYHVGHIVIRVPLGSNGPHTLRLWGSGTPIDVLAWEFRTGLATGYLVSNVAITGKGMGTLVTSDESTGTYGLPLLDTAMRGLAGTCLIPLFTNEWTGPSGTTSTVKANAHTAIARVKAGGYRAIPVVMPQPNPSLQGGSMTYTQMVTAAAEQCTADSVDFLNLQKLWTSPSETSEAAMFNDGNGAGYFFDQIHPSDAGATSIAAAVRSFLGV